MTYEYERAAAPGGALRLHLNENTAGCSPKVIAALQRLTKHDIATYPDYDVVVRACAARLDVAPERLLLTNGLDDGILAASVSAMKNSPLDAPLEGVVVVPAFDMYAACIDAAGGRVVEVPLAADFAFPIQGVLDAISPRTRAVFLTTPHNPTGAVLAREHIIAIAGAAPRALVFVDEAYVDFSGQTVIGDAFVRLTNVVVGRTFAKAYGLAGLRAGALVGHPETLAPLRRTVAPYTLNVAAMVALPAAFEDVEYYDWYVEQVRASRVLLARSLDRLGIRHWPSEGNFVLARFGVDLHRVIAGLAARQVIIRDRSKDPGCAGCARITAGVVEHTERCVEALEEVLCGAG
jgi:histidinol-phosphate aminotransferase